MASELIAGVAPAGRRVRAYFAPVNRVSGAATIFDASGLAGFDSDAPPAPWVDLGWLNGFTRTCGTKIEPLIAGAPGFAAGQVRVDVDATVSVEFDAWGKIQMALTAGMQQMNVLRAMSNAAANGSGGKAITATVLLEGSTASALNVGAQAAAGFVVGDLISVDVDYAGQTGFVGSGLSGGFVRSAAAIGTDVDYVRRVSLNVGRVVGIADGVLTLGAALLAGAPAGAMKVSRVVGFCDREGGSFFQEWSGLFVFDGVQGDRVAYHYPRLQAMSGAAEASEGLVGVSAGSLEKVRLAGRFRALPVTDVNDGERVVCFRSYVPGSLRTV